MNKTWALFFSGMLLWLVCAGSAAGGTINNPGAAHIPDFDDELAHVPAAQLGGWFSGGNPDFPDPAQPWTSGQNIALMNYWARLVAQAGDDPQLLAQLYGLGMTDPQVSSGDLPGALNQFSQTNSAALTNVEQPIGGVPEPATLGLLGCAVAMLGLYVTTRCHATKR